MLRIAPLPAKLPNLVASAAPRAAHAALHGAPTATCLQLFTVFCCCNHLCSGGAKGNDERDQTLNQMLSEMDGFDNEAQVGCYSETGHTCCQANRKHSCNESA